MLRIGSVMKRLSILLLLSVMADLMPGTAHAVYLTSQELTQNCMADAEKNNFYCLGYIAGVIDYHVMLQSLGTAPTIDFCMPPDLSVEQAAVVVLSYLKKSPQHTDFIAGPAITLALHERFPCAPPSPSRRKKR
jgi:hypothetical protein